LDRDLAGTDAVIHDIWDAAGLRGTGSHDIEVRGMNVPADQLPAPLFEAPRHDGPFWRIPFFTQVGMAMMGFPLGVARRALDEIIELAPTKVRPPLMQPIALDENLQVELAKAEASLLAARSFAYDAIGEVWATACAGDLPSLEDRAPNPTSGTPRRGLASSNPPF
jgi:alkylation response protein AidB-like acyl-CoA dehydrogenase